MPRSRSSPSSNTDKKAQKGGKAAEFLSKHFNAIEEENDPIEVRVLKLSLKAWCAMRMDIDMEWSSQNSSPPPRAIVRRIKPTLCATAGKIQEALPNPLRYDELELFTL